MNRQEFEQLRDLPGKRVAADIRFAAVKGASPNLLFSEVPVENSLGLEVVLNGTYKPALPAVTFNFVLRGTGPICRVTVNGTHHKDAGRTHKNDLRREEDARLNLPSALARPDLDGKTAREVWQTLCQQANIEHVGEFHPPEEEAS